MVKCNKDCVPCCDFCVYAIHDKWEEDDKEVVGGPVGCKKHPDDEHQKIAESCGSCEDFHCFRADSKGVVNES